MTSVKLLDGLLTLSYTVSENHLKWQQVVWYRLRNNGAVNPKKVRDVITLGHWLDSEV